MMRVEEYSRPSGQREGQQLSARFLASVAGTLLMAGAALAQSSPGPDPASAFHDVSNAYDALHPADRRAGSPSPSAIAASLEKILANDDGIRGELANVDDEIEQSRHAITNHPEADIVRAKVAAYVGFLKRGAPAVTPESAETLRTNLETLITYGSDNYPIVIAGVEAWRGEVEYLRATGSADTQLQHFARAVRAWIDPNKPTYAASGDGTYLRTIPADIAAIRQHYDQLRDGYCPREFGGYYGGKVIPDSDPDSAPTWSEVSPTLRTVKGPVSVATACQTPELIDSADWSTGHQFHQGADPNFRRFSAARKIFTDLGNEARTDLWRQQRLQTAVDTIQKAADRWEAGKGS
jgi:hypothetical protein